jgi:periplasmic protein TonB
MSKDLKSIQNFDDIVFRIRNREYGAFILRKEYSRNIIISLLIGSIILTAVIITPYFSYKKLKEQPERVERKVNIILQNLNQPVEIVVPPPRPPANVVQQVKYVPPVVVDSIKVDDTVQLMSAEAILPRVKIEEVPGIIKEAKEELQETENEHEPFLTVQEMPEPRGGEKGLYKFIADNTSYPVKAKENNIGGKVFLRFCVTSKGAVDHVSVLKGVDPDLDAEAIRVVKIFPPFKPGKQDGKPVPVWYSVSINFQLY